VVGTGVATAQIKNGQRLRVDGTNGTVTILDGNGAS
jgi:pyruvate,water dikinase